MIDLNPLIDLDRLAREDGKKYPQQRFLYKEIALTLAKPEQHFYRYCGAPRKDFDGK